jgi:hypothetical protein
VALIKQLNFDRVPSGGAGNKMLMLLEGKGAAYIQDRGVSRWGEHRPTYCGWVRPCRHHRGSRSVYLQGVVAV